MPGESIVLLARDGQRRRRKRPVQWGSRAMCCRNMENERTAARRTGSGSGSWGTDTMVARAPVAAGRAWCSIPSTRPHGKRGPLHRHRSRRRGLGWQRRSVLGGKYSNQSRESDRTPPSSDRGMAIRLAGVSCQSLFAATRGLATRVSVSQHAPQRARARAG